MDAMSLLIAYKKWDGNIYWWVQGQTTDISQYRLRFGSSLLYKSVFHLNRLTAQLSYEGRAAVEGGK
jgi:hypothetical protein